MPPDRAGNIGEDTSWGVTGCFSGSGVKKGRDDADDMGSTDFLFSGTSGAEGEGEVPPLRMGELRIIVIDWLKSCSMGAARAEIVHENENKIGVTNCKKRLRKALALYQDDNETEVDRIRDIPTT